MRYQKSQITHKEAGMPRMRIIDLIQVLSKPEDGGPDTMSEG